MACKKITNWQEFRELRQKLLTETDGAADCGSPAMRTYRQLLRDIPQTYSDVADIILPVKPDF